jgi:hypothetical protein
LAAPGYLPLSQEINLLNNETRTLQLVLVAERKAALVTNPTTESPSAKPYVMIAEGALSLGGVAAGVVFALDQSEAERELRGWSPKGDSSCLNNNSLECVQAREVRQHALDAERNKWISFSVASVGALAVIGTWLFWSTDEPAPVQVSFVPQPRGAWMSLGGAF